MRYYLGLDNGGSTTKAALFDKNGREVAVSNISAAMLTPKPGFVERDMEEMWEANCQVIRDVLRKADICAGDVAGVGITGHGKGLYLWGKDGKPARNGIISTDNRAYEYTNRWKSDGTEAKVFEKSCQHIMACQPVSLLAWIKDNERSVYDNIKWVFECKDYVRFRMTGTPSAEITDYSCANLMNLHTVQYDEELLKLFGIGEIIDCLPPICSSTEICGFVSEDAAEKCGLNEGTPVIGGMVDIDACALGAGITDEERICMIAGTWSINEYIRSNPILDGKVLMNSLYCIPGYYLIEESSPTSAGNNEWFVRQLLPEFVEEHRKNGDSYYDDINSWVENIPPEEFVPTFLPFVLASNVHPNAKGCFIGISANHTRGHLVRSIYEGVAFCHKMHAEKLINSRESRPTAIRLAGGAAHSNVWTQIFADTLQLSIETVAANETGALGCAIAVAVAVGDYDNITAACTHMCNIVSVSLPNLDKAAVYEKKYHLYKRAIECLDPLWDNMQALVGTGG